MQYIKVTESALLHTNQFMCHCHTTRTILLNLKRKIHFSTVLLSYDKYQTFGASGRHLMYQGAGIKDHWPDSSDITDAIHEGQTLRFLQMQRIIMLCAYILICCYMEEFSINQDLDINTKMGWTHTFKMWKTVCLIYCPVNLKSHGHSADQQIPCLL